MKLKLSVMGVFVYTFRMFYYEERAFNRKVKVLSFILPEIQCIGEKCGNKQNQP